MGWRLWLAILQRELRAIKDATRSSIVEHTSYPPISRSVSADTPQAGSVLPSNNFSVSIDCDSLDEAERLFTALTKRVPLPFKQALFPLGAVTKACQITLDCSDWG